MIVFSKPGLAERQELRPRLFIAGFVLYAVLYYIWYDKRNGHAMVSMKRIYAGFHASPSDKTPVRDWLLSVDRADRQVIGEDIAGRSACRCAALSGTSFGRCAAACRATASRGFCFPFKGTAWFSCMAL